MAYGVLAETEAHTWRLSDQPEMAAEVGDEVRLVTSVRRRDGSVVAVDGAALSLLTVAPSGRAPLPLKVGNLTQVQHGADDVLQLFDSGTNTVLRVEPDDRMATQALPSGGDGFPIGFLAAGVLVTARSSDPHARQAIDSIVYRFTDSSDHSVETPLRPGAERRRIGTTAWAPMVFAAEPLEAIHRNHLHAAYGGRPELVTYNAAGEVIQRVTWQAEAVPVSLAEGQEEVAREAHGDDGSVRQEGPRPALARGDVRPILPVLRRLLAGRDSTLWVELYPKPGQSTHEWIVFSDAGRPLGRLSVPRAYVLTEVTGQVVLGIWRGASGRGEQVRSYRLQEGVR